MTQIETLIISYAPVIVALLGLIYACLKIVKIVNEIKSDNVKRDQVCQTLMQENCSLKKTIKDLVVKIDRIARGE